MNLDAYTLRKIAPRLFLAVIGVNLSIYLCIAAIDITTVVGHGLGQLIRGPFDVAGVLDSPKIDQGAGNIAFGASAVLLILVAVPALKGGALATMFFLLLPVFVLILSILITLVLRQALIVLLTLISPVAIVLSVLPGTEKYFKQWWDLFIKTLVVYPIIAALFAISDVLTAISFAASNQGGNTTGAVDVISGVMFAFMPLVMIPFAFRFAGGALGAFTNATAGMRGMANRMASSRLQKNFQKGFEDIKAGGLFTNYATDGEGRGKGLRHRMNRGASRLANLDKMRLTRPRGSVNQAMENAIMQRAKALGETAEAQALHGFDDEHWANAHADGTASDLERKLKEKAPERFDEDYLTDEQKRSGYVLSAAEKSERRQHRIEARDRIMNMNKVHGTAAGRAFSAMTLPSISTSFEEQFYKKDAAGNVTSELWRKGDGDEFKSDVVAKTSHDQMQEMILRASGGNTGLGNYMLAQAISGAKQAGRYDLAASASANLLYQEAMRTGDARAIEQAKEAYDEKLLDRLTPAQALQGHVRGTKESVGALRRRIEKVNKEMLAIPAKDTEAMGKKKSEMIQLLARAAAWQEALPSASKEASEIVQKELLGYRPEDRFGADGEATVEELVRDVRNAPEMAQLRREWGTAEEGGAEAEHMGREAALAREREEAAKRAAEGPK